MSKVDEAFEAALARVYLAQERLTAWDFAMRGARDPWSRADSPELMRDAASVRAVLSARMNEAYADLFMFGCVLGRDAQKRAKLIAYKHFVAERSAIMQYLDAEGVYPGSYTVKEEEEFRRALAELKESGA